MAVVVAATVVVAVVAVVAVAVVVVAVVVAVSVAVVVLWSDHRRRDCHTVKVLIDEVLAVVVAVVL